MKNFNPVTILSVEKAASGAAYINIKEFKTRFENNSGRWLIITTNEIRMQGFIPIAPKLHRERKLEEEKIMYDLDLIFIIMSDYLGIIN